MALTWIDFLCRAGVLKFVMGSHRAFLPQTVETFSTFPITLLYQRQDEDLPADKLKKWAVVAPFESWLLESNEATFTIGDKHASVIAGEQFCRDQTIIVLLLLFVHRNANCITERV